MVVGFTTTHAISAYHHRCCEFESLSGQGVFVDIGGIDDSLFSLFV
jgi:hypothetical protein